MQQQNPFNQNPLTRNRVLPTVSFVSSPDEAKNLKVPETTFSSYDEMMEQYNSLVVPNQLPDPTKTCSNDLIQLDKSPLTKDEWTKWRFATFSDSHGNWGDAYGRKESAKEQEIDKKSAEFAKRSRIENAKLSAELEKDEFRKKLLADVEAGKIFDLTKLEEVDESAKVQYRQTNN